MSFKFTVAQLCPQDDRITVDRLPEFNSYYKTKYDICKKINPKKIAEIGVRAGYSAWSFLQAAPTAEYVGIDADNGTHGGQGGEDGRYHRWAIQLLSPYRASFITADTQKLQVLDLCDIDLFHVDGDHTAKGVQHDLDIVYPCMSDGGVILVDDITYLTTVKNGCDAWVAAHRDAPGFHFQVEFLPSLRGEMLLRVSKK
jgi:hypothetical protein